jgi:predicted nucleic acid-binding protein
LITAVDTSVLLDVFRADPSFGPASREALRAATTEGRAVACAAVWAEVAAAFPADEAAREALDTAGIEFSPTTADAAMRAARAWTAYRARGGRRQRVVADFLIGGHATVAADRLLTRDRGFYRAYFRGLTIFDPSR